jgi:hypothetical protein
MSEDYRIGIFDAAAFVLLGRLIEAAQEIVSSISYVGARYALGEMLATHMVLGSKPINRSSKIPWKYNDNLTKTTANPTVRRQHG